MDPRRPGEVAPPPEAVAFVRFCYRRRRVGWPELYDEMCAVASRGLYNGWGITELAEHGIGFSLHETPGLAQLAQEVVREEIERRRQVAIGQVGQVAPVVTPVGLSIEPAEGPAGIASVGPISDGVPVAVEALGLETVEPSPVPILRLAGATAG